MTQRIGRSEAMAYLKELAWVVPLHYLLIVLVVHMGRWFNREEGVGVLVAAVFVGLPVLVLDRTGKPYDRYGMRAIWKLRDFWGGMLVMIATFGLVVVGVWMVPSVWGMRTLSWQMPALSDDYLSFVLVQFVVVALPEEFFYRGYLLGRIGDCLGAWRPFSEKGAQVLGIVVSAALFALGHCLAIWHPSRLLVFFPALIFGWLRVKTGSLVIPIAYHGCSNVFMDLFRSGLD